MIKMKTSQQKLAPANLSYVVLLMVVFLPLLASGGVEPEGGIENTRSPEFSLFAGSTFPAFEIEIGGESFFMFEQADKRGLGGLSAIMVDLDGKLSDRIHLFAAFHFDSSVWHDFLNLPMDIRRNDASAYDVELEVEEFFLTYTSPLSKLEISVGRMFSVISYANQLHLADFQFNMKPRIFSEYWGSNHGLALDGGSVKWSVGQGPFRASLVAEAAKNSYETEAMVMTSVLDLVWKNEKVMAGLRGFGYFDHEHAGHPLLAWLPDFPEIELSDHGKPGLNAFGAGMNAAWALTPGNYVFLQAEWMNRTLSGMNFNGGYAFILWPFGEKFEGSLMYQQLERPVISETQLSFIEEKAYTFGLSYFPLINHRLRLEYAIFNDSHFYENMFTAKWTFYVTL